MYQNEKSAPTRSPFRDAAGVDWRYAYDGSNRLAAVFKAAPFSVAHVTNVYDNFGRVKTQTDARGNTTTFYLSGYRNIEAFPDGSQTVYVFGRDRLFTAREDTAGNRVIFDYDGLGRLVRMTDRLGDETVFAYHPAIARVIAATNARGETTAIAYSARPSNPLCYDLARVDYPGGDYETFGHDAAGNVTAHRDGAGESWAATYNARGQRLSLTNPEGGVETRVYHTDGTLTSVTDGDVSAVTFQYDTFKRLSRITHSGGAYETFVRDALGRATSYADAEGRTTALQYDENGRAIRLTDPSARATSFAYDAMDNLVAITNRMGAVTSFAYDSLNRRVGKTDATGVGTTFAYDARGRLTTMARGGRAWATVHDDEGVLGGLVTPDGSTNSIMTDRLGMVAGLSNALGQSSAYTRDAAGRVTAFIDPCGRTNGYAADGEGRLTGVTLPSLDSATYANDGNGLLERLTDLNGQQWNLTRTAMGRRLALSDPLARVCSYGYDARGRLASVANPDDTTLTVTLDDVGNTRRLLHSDGPDLQYDYDANHRLTNANGVVVGRDHEGRIVSTTDGAEVCGAAYDAAGRLTAANCDGGAFAVTYAYAIGPGGSGLLTGVWDNVTSARVSFGYDAAGRLHTLAFSNGETVTYTWNAANRLVRVQSGVHVDETVTYDASGQITGKQLVAPLLPGPNLPALGFGVTVDAASQLVSPGYVHDARGRVAATPEHALTWDGASRAIAIDGVALAYNGLGQVRTRTANGTTTRLLYNHSILSAPPTVELNEGTGQTLRYYVWTPGGRLLYSVDAAAGHAVRFYHFDAAGSTLALTDMAGSVTDAYAYDPYGRIVARTGVNPQPFTFAGAWGVRQEGSGGLYQMRARYYDAGSGRFLSPEPLWPLVRDPKALNPYAYAGGDPVRFIDPTGLDPEVPLINEQQIRDQVNDLMQELKDIQQDIALDACFNDQANRDLIYQALDERYGDEDQTEINELLAWLAELDAARAERAERIKADEARIRRLVNGRRQAAVKLLNQVAQWKKVLQDIRKNDIESAAYHLQVGERDAAKEDMARVGRTEQEIQGVDTLEYSLNHFLRQDSLGVR